MGLPTISSVQLCETKNDTENHRGGTEWHRDNPCHLRHLRANPLAFFAKALCAFAVKN